MTERSPVAIRPAPGGEDGQAGHAVLNGRYALGGLIAEGGMAQVFRGHDLRLDRAVAIKLLRPQYAALADVRARFAREARLAAALVHPHVVQVFDVGRDGEDYYIVLELLPGRTLKDLLAGGPVPLGEAARLAQQVASGMAAAHHRGLVHRDLKPQNVLLAEDGSAKVGDFGLAQAAGASHLTVPGTIWGTVAYLSPEQAQGYPADARSDVYALGVICYELLTGLPPYEAETPAAILHQHVFAPVPRVRDRNPLLPAVAEAIVARALAKAPDDRFQSMEELAKALEALHAAEPSPVTPRRWSKVLPPSVGGHHWGPVEPAAPEDQTQVIWAPPAATVSAGPSTFSGQTRPAHQPPLPPPRDRGPTARRRGAPIVLGAAIVSCFAIMALILALLREVVSAPPRAQPREGPAATSLPLPTATVARTATGSAAPTALASAIPTTAGAPGTTGSAVPTASPSAAAATATPLSTPLALGTYARLGGWSVTIARYEWSAVCPGGGRLAPGRKVVTLQVAGRNDLSTTLPVPAAQWTLAGQPASAGPSLPCQPSDQDGPVAQPGCLPAATLPAGARCAGRLVFEVPAAVDVPGALVQVRAPGTGTTDTATWRLPS